MRKPEGQIVLLLLALALLAAWGWSQPTENLDIIWTIPGDTSLYAFGASLASGDVNGDGIPDVIVACDTYDVNHGTTRLRGRVNIYYGNHVGETVPDLVLRSPVWVGSNPPVLACGDVNGDGYADIAMGEDCADDALGICTVWLGGDPMDTVPDYIIHGGSWWLEAHLGYSISLGDVNGDGHDDLVVGAYFTAERPGHDGTGRVYLYHGGSGFDTIPDVTLLGGHEGECEGFGIGVSAEGDFDHDGFHDLYVGAWCYGSDGRGRMYGYYGGNPMDTNYDMAMSGEGPSQALGWMKPGFLASQGDFDYGVEGNPFWPHGFFGPDNCGKVYVHEGGRPMDSIPDVCLVGRKDSAELGMSAQSAGDASGDGDDDLVAGAPCLPPYYTGATYLWQTGAHFDTVPDAWLMGADRETEVGFMVSTAGDLDGDGRAEFMVSNYPADGPKCVWVCKYTGVGLQEEEALRIPSGTALRAYPNPCRDRVWVSCPPVVGENSTLRVYNVTGRAVRTLMFGWDEASRATRTVSWDLRDKAGRRVGQGVYVIELEQDSGNATRRCSAKVVVERQ
jgi:hypothetical protein